MISNIWSLFGFVACFLLYSDTYGEYHKICSGCKCEHASLQTKQHSSKLEHLHHTLNSCKELCDAKNACLALEYKTGHKDGGKCYQCSSLHTAYRRRTSRRISTVWRKVPRSSNESMTAQETASTDKDNLEHSSNFDFITTSTMSNPINVVRNVSLKQQYVESGEAIDMVLNTKEHNSTAQPDLEKMVDSTTKSQANRTNEIYLVLFLSVPIFLWMMIHFGFKIYNN